MLEVAVLIVTAFFNILLGLLVLLKNPKGATHIAFFGLTLSFSTWSIANYFSLHPILFPQLYWVRLVLFLAAILCLFLFLTFRAFPGIHFGGNPLQVRIAILYTVFVACLTLSQFVFSDLTVTATTVKPVVAPGVIFFALQTIGLVTSAVVIVVRKLMRSHGIEKQQLKLVLLGIAGSFTLIVATNFILVAFLNTTTFLPLGPAFTLIFSGSLAYAILKHHLLDIRAIVARSLTYILSLGFFIGVYIYLGILLSSRISAFEISTGQQLVVGLFAILLALSFQTVKAFFDKVTNRIFYRDAYDTQRVLNSIGKVIVSEVDSGALLFESLELISESLKPLHTGFMVLDKGKNVLKAAGNTPALRNIKLAHEHLSNQKSIVYVVDDRLKQTALVKYFKQTEVAISVKLVTNEGTVGYLLIGPKRSGNIYNSQDIKLLGIAANELSVAVQNARRFDEIQAFNLTLQQKINEATAELRQTNKKLRELDEAKDEFISMASHQLRTPLTSMKGYISMVMEGDAGKVNKEQTKLLEEAFASSQRMVYLIADMLNVSRLKTGKFNIEKTVIDLPKLVTSEMEQLLPTAKTKDLTLTFHVPRSFPKVYLDETKMRQVIMNFADNAIHYTPPGGKIDVKLIATADRIEYTVTDTGIGVSKQEFHKLFTKFFRAANARNTRPDGTGLGLYMAQKVVSAQDGSVIFESELGKGSTFGFRFPINKVKPPKGAATKLL